jgi:methylase of polypeptide subunit release factors
MPNDPQALAALLSGAGFVSAEEEAEELLARAAGDAELLESLVERRLTGEPLAWITGRVTFCGLEILVDPASTFPAGRASRWRVAPSSACRRPVRRSISVPDLERSRRP